MYKRLLPVLFLSLCSGAAMAQATLTAATTNPLVGDVNAEYRVSGADPGDSAANVTWDFSSLVYTATDTQTYTACSQSPYCSDFPGTTIAGLDAASAGGIFFNNSDSKESVDGIYEISPIVYSDYEDFFHYPFTYNDIYTDPFTATFTSAGYTYKRSGNVTVKADGYGTLILPYGTISNVLRIHRTEVYSDSANIAGNPVVISYVSNIYTWYSPAHRSELMDISSISIDGQGGIVTSYYTKDFPTTGVSQVNSVDETLQVYPNPATDQINIRFDNESSDVVRISIVDIVGKEIAVINNSKLNAGLQQISYATKALSTGLYFIKLQTSNSIITRKVDIL